jgi:hypothetical protein
MRGLLIIIQLCISLNVIAQVDTTNNLSDTEKILGLSKFWSEAKYNFVYFDRAKIDWDSTYAAFIPKILATKNTWNYYLFLQQFAALLKDGHTDINEPDKVWTGSRYKFIDIKNVSYHFYVVNIERKDSAKVPLGSELLSVNGMPLLDYLKTEMFPYLSASTQTQLWDDAARYMFYAVDTTKTWKLNLKTPDGNLISYTAYFHTYPRDWEVKDVANWKRTNFRMINDVGYFQVNTFADAGIIDDFKKELPQLRKCKGIILDLRLNGGGNSAIGAELLKYFTDTKILIGSKWQARENISAFKAWGAFLKDKNIDSLSDFDKKSVEVYNGNYWYQGDTMMFENNIKTPKITSPLVVLIGNNTASAAEDFLIILSNLKGRAKTIGQTTYGSTGQPLTFQLPGGGTARICAKKDTYPNGKEFVGYGIKPDIPVEENIKDILDAKDRTLNTAIEELREEIK